MKIGLYVNDSNELSLKTSEKFVEILKNGHIDSFSVKEYPERSCDLLVVFGGDGTTVRAINYAVTHDVVTLAVNTGTLGFLSDFNPDRLQDVFDLLNREIPYSKRTLIEVEYKGEKAFCLNDAVIQRKPVNQLVSQVVKLNVYLNGETVDKYFADGLVFSTPTGSTAYSLSAGGAVLTPETKAFIITPICSHSFLSRPIVYSDDGIVKVEKSEKSADVVCYADGRYFCELTDGELIIKKSEKYLKLYKFKKEFFKKLSLKFNRVLGE